MLNCIGLEIATTGEQTKSAVQSIYFGGGTPSLLSASELSNLLVAIHKNFEVNPNAEITLEANPDDISESKANDWIKLGINRLSIGVQSFHSKDLISMNRSHDSEQAFAAIQTVKNAGFTNYSVDLMFALPLLTNDNWRENLKQAVSLKIPHLSCYNLTIEEQSALIKMIEKGKQIPLSESKSTRQFEILMETLAQNGYEQYEISNFCLPSQESKHNSAYWEQKAYYGIGPSAHSYVNGNRYHNIAHNVQYMNGIEQKISVQQQEELSPENKFNEYIMTRLRCKTGVDMEYLKRNFSQLYGSIEPAIASESAKGNLILGEKAIRLSTKGKFIADQVAMELFV